MTRKVVHVTTSPLNRLLGEVEAIVDDLEASLSTEPLVVDFREGRDHHRDSRKAALARDCLRAAELAALLAQEFHVRYWQIKGHDDPRSEG